MRKFLTVLTVLLFSCVVYAQNRTISGKVTDDGGTPVSFASIKIKGSKKGVAADANGFFSIPVEKTGDITLVVSAQGFDEREVAVGSDNVVNVTLKRAANQLQEVVVTTALNVKRQPKSIGYAAANVTPAQITSSKAFNLGQALTNKVSGLTVYNTSAAVNAAPRIVLRGLRSITGDNTALIVLDGVPVPSNTLNYINPNDVESISILKGGQAATLFGSDGVNGAIVITTKKGTVKKPEVTFTQTYNVERLSFQAKFQNEFGSGSAYGADLNEDFHPAENQEYGPAFDGSLRPLGRALANGKYQLVPYAAIPGIRDALWDKGSTSQTDVSYRSGTESSNFFVSYQNLSSKGIVFGDKYNRNAFRMNSSNTYGKLKVGFDATYTWDRADRTNSDFYFLAINQNAWAPLDQLKDWKNNPFADPSGYFNDYYNNPWWEMDNNRFETKNNFFNGNLNLNFKINNSLDITGRVGVANTQTVTTTTSNPYTYNAWSASTSGAYLTHYNRNYDFFLTNGGLFRARSTPIPGGLGESYSNGNRINADIFTTYKHNLSSSVNLNAIVGGNVQVRTSKAFNTSTAALGVADFFNLTNSGTGLFTSGNSRTESRKMGAYVDVTVGFNNYLFLHGTSRYDWSSVFYLPGRPSSYYGYYTYGGDVSFVLTDAFPVIKGKVLNFAKLRAGYNTNANDNLSAHQLEPIFTNAPGFPFSGLLGTSVGNTTISPSLKAEKVQSSEVGAELGFLQNRINIEGSYYVQQATQQILNVSISSASGYSSYLLNAADVTNKGFEVDLKTVPYRNRNVQVNLNFNYSRNTNKVNKLYADNGLNSLIYQGDNNKTLNAELGQMFPYLKTTAWLRDPQGHVVIDPADGWALKQTSTIGIGNTIPKNIFGVNMSVTYKFLTLSANAEYRGDYVVYHDLGEDMAFTGSSAITTLYHRQQFVWPNSVYYDGSKYVPNTNYAVNQYIAGYQATGDLGFSRGFQGTGEAFYSSGDFWKLREISLSYDFKIPGIEKVIKSLSFTVWGRNLKTWIAKDNFFNDPEFSNTNGNSTGLSTSLNTPPTRQIGATLKVVF
ncbi:MAG: SusC/RagA family TonB-linked outer membrane protein [Sphingobacteriales bacterium]|nr:MAG: SusC/RagA family TonB-linked outer membrane protein [Sphingobacteriales bacterium]